MAIGYRLVSLPFKFARGGGRWDEGFLVVTLAARVVSVAAFSRLSSNCSIEIGGWSVDVEGGDLGTRSGCSGTEGS